MVGGVMTIPFENDISVLDLGTLDPSLLQDVIRFANSALKQWSGRLSIYNWNGDNAGGGTDQVFFGSNPSGLTEEQRNRISFYEDGGETFLGTAKHLPSGEIVPHPVPEPTAGMLVLAGALGFLQRRRRA